MLVVSVVVLVVEDVMVDCATGVQDGQDMELNLHPAEWGGGGWSLWTFGID